MDKFTINMIFLVFYILGFQGLGLAIYFALLRYHTPYLFIVFLIVYTFLFSFIFNKLSKKIREREDKGFVQFFPHHMIISQKETITELKYNEVQRVSYSISIVDNYFAKNPNPVTRYYKFICVDERIFFFECECFIQANRQDRIDKNLPDVGRVIKRIMPSGGIAENKREIRKFLKKMKKDVES